MHGVANRAGFVIDESMTAVSFPGQTPVSFSLSDKVNTNTVLYFADGATVNARVLSILKNRGLNNVVIGPAAENIVIADGLDFLAPKAFTAATVSLLLDGSAEAQAKKAALRGARSHCLSRRRPSRQTDSRWNGSHPPQTRARASW